LQYFFEGYAFDVGTRELRCGRDLVSIAPQVFDLLEYLIRNRDRVVTKDELIDAIWSGRSVSDAALTTRLNVARNAIGDSGNAQRLIKTLPRRGFRFVAAVEEVREPEPSLSDGLPANGASYPGAPVDHGPIDGKTAPRLSIVVLPFTSMGGSPEQERFADAVTETLIADLSRTRIAFVVARNDASKHNGQAVDVRQLGRELNVRYVLEGSIQRDADRLRVSAQLIDAESGRHFWAERFEQRAIAPFELQDEIASQIAHLVNVRLVLDAARRAKHLAHPKLGDLIIQGMASMFKGVTPAFTSEARNFFERVLAIDSGHVAALVSLANVEVMDVFGRLTDDPTGSLSRAEANVLKALSLSPNHAVAFKVLGAAYAMTNRVEQGIAALERSVTLDQSQTLAHACIGFVKCFMGRAVEAEGHILEALRRSPLDMDTHAVMYLMGELQIHRGSDAKAVDWLRRSIETNRNLPPAHFALAAALALLGRRGEAREAAQAGLALNPGFTIRRLRNSNFSDNPTYLAGIDRLVAGMRLAGVPEG
jgi:TolB-like protein/DNA-binding winged helix-turn-helix (wHTH) protein